MTLIELMEHLQKIAKYGGDNSEVVISIPDRYTDDYLFIKDISILPDGQIQIDTKEES